MNLTANFSPVTRLGLLQLCLLLSPIMLGACGQNTTQEAAQAAAPQPAPGLSLTNARVMQVLPGKSITSGYFDLQNNLSESVELVGASSPGVRSIEMHEIVQDGDKVRMRRLSNVSINPGATLHFASGAKHLMLFGVSELPESLEITLKFADGSETAATFQQQRW